VAGRVAVLGAGCWGMALANLLDSGGNQVCLWEFDPAEYEKLLRHHGNPDRLRDFRLPETVDLTNDAAYALEAAEFVILATPSQHLRSVISPLGDRLRRARGIVNVAKGIEAGTLTRMSQVVTDECDVAPDRVGTLSGPSHAEEVILDMPTTVVAASSSEPLACETQRLFSVDNFRVYISQDLVGVELGGSLKNIIAIAAGIADGLGLGDNTKGALITRGLAEITRLGVAMGAQVETFAGLSGIGDLVTTCMSGHSRNRLVGERIGRGQSLEHILSELKMVAEGVETTRSGLELARGLDVEMPITNEVYRVLFEGKSASEAVSDLMGRELKAEIWR